MLCWALSILNSLGQSDKCVFVQVDCPFYTVYVFGTMPPGLVEGIIVRMRKLSSSADIRFHLVFQNSVD